MNLAAWRDLIWYLNIAATAILLVQLIVQRLYRSYPLLLCYFLVDLSCEIILIRLGQGSPAYFYAYLSGQAIKLVLVTFVVLELYRLALVDHPALAKFGRRAGVYLLLLLVGAVSSSLYFGPPVPPRRGPLLHYFLSFERAIDTALVVYLVAISIFILWFPLKLRRNAALYIAGFVAYFLTHAAALLAVNTWPAYTRGLNVAALSSSLVCLVAWVALLRPEGESNKVVTGHFWNPDEIERLSRQLQAINARLMRIQ